MIYLNSGWALGSFFSFFSSPLISPFIGIILESRAEKGSPGGGIRRFSPSSPSSSSSRCFIRAFIPDPPIHRQNIRIHPRSSYSQTKYQNSSQFLLFIDKILEFIPDPPIHRQNIRIHPRSSYSQTTYYVESSQILLFIDKILEFIPDLQNNSKQLFKQQIYLYILKSSLSRRLCFLKYMQIMQFKQVFKNKDL